MGQSARKHFARQDNSSKASAKGHNGMCLSRHERLGQTIGAWSDVRLEQQVIGLSRHGEQWLLSVKSDEVPVPATAGPFDAVLLAIPAEQAAVLLKEHASFANTVAGVHMQPCWALMLAFQNPLNLAYDGAWVEDSRLHGLRTTRQNLSIALVNVGYAHASAAWSTEHLGGRS